MLTANVRKIKKSVHYNITFISGILSENLKNVVISFIENIANLRKTCFFSKTRLFAHVKLCGNISRRKCKCIQFNTLT